MDSTPTIVKLNATHNVLSMKMQELRFDQAASISSVKDQLERRFGSAAQNLSLQLLDANGALLSEMSNDQETLKHYGAVTGCTIHVVDNDPSQLTRDLEDVGQVPKYVISEEKFAARKDTFRHFKQTMQEKNPGPLPKGNYFGEPEDYQVDAAALLELNKQCLLVKSQKTGTIAYIGKVAAKGPGYWVGVKLDEATGNTNGTFDGHQYFEAGEKGGLFVRPNALVMTHLIQAAEGTQVEEEDMI